MTFEFRNNKTVFIQILVILALLFISHSALLAQNVGINNPVPHTKSVLDVTSSDKGMLIPRMTQAAKDGMFPAQDLTAKGMLIYQTNGDAGIYQFNGTSWEKLTTEKSGWNLNGNTGTNPASNFIGTTDNQPIIFRTNNTEKVRISQNGKLGIGINPFWALDVSDNQAVGRFVTWNHGNGSVIELRNMRSANTAYVGAVNFNDSMNVTPGQLGYLSDHSMTFRTNQFERMRIAANGYVGIGTTTPDWKLDIEDPVYGLRITTTNSSSGAIVNLRNTTPALPLLGQISFNDAANNVQSVFSYSTNEGMKFMTGGISERMRITPSGQVGIGTFSPARRVHIDGSDINPPLLIKNTTPNSYSGIHFDNLTGTGRSHIGFGNTGSNWSDAGYVGTVTASPFIFTTSDVEQMRLTPTGRLGIGTNNPTVRLHLADATGLIPMVVTSLPNNGYSVTQYYFDLNNRGHVGMANPGAGNHPGSFIVGSISMSPVEFTTGDITRMRINSNGNVGVGTLNPTSTLEVNGFTKLGSNAPAIKYIELSGVTAATQGSTSSIPHGLSSTKILSVEILVEYAPGNLIPYGYEMSSGYHFNFFVSPTHISVTNLSGVSSQILSKPFKVLVTYKE